MAWFSRKDRSADPAAEAVAADDGSDDEAPELPLRPAIERIGPEELDRIRRGRALRQAAGVGSDDLDAIGAAFDAALERWLSARKEERENERDLVELFGIAVGDHLDSVTDLSWSKVTDAFGTDLGVAGGRDDFTVVPTNLVAVRWMNQESGWIPGVVGHLVRVREER